jgi:hypothetical protein
LERKLKEMLKWTVECEEKYGVCERFDINPGWMNYFVDEGLWWDTCYFDSDEQALCEFWKIMKEYDNNYEVVDSLVKSNETILTIKITSTNPDSNYFSVKKYRVFSEEPHVTQF